MWIRIFILMTLLIISIINACLRHWEVRSNFIDILILQVMAIREIWAYLFNKKMWLWSGQDIEEKEDSLARKFVCGFYLTFYLILFFKS
ncbi:hypothetical protein C7W93_19915 [Glaciimonas sp. PCH181]|nr:hypothetical protein C7W93_19915 [Glaciimonas sp. PCH181]